MMFVSDPSARATKDAWSDPDMFSQIAREIQSIPVCLRDKEVVLVSQKAWRVNLVEFHKCGAVIPLFRRAPLLSHTQQAHEIACLRYSFRCVCEGIVCVRGGWERREQVMR